jgi:lysophospholipase L1-like esterase
MLECLILGDSIAVGVAQYRPECVAYAKGGINSRQWVNSYITKDLSADTVIISLGSNDHAGVKTVKELRTIRELTKAKRVFWMLPSGVHPKNNVPVSEIQKMVRLVAEENGDIVLTVNRLQTDRIHPSTAGYKELANNTR